jgi:hypothetical protein
MTYRYEAEAHPEIKIYITYPVDDAPVKKGCKITKSVTKLVDYNIVCGVNE